MPAQLALFASFGLIAWLYRQDARERPVGSKALWIPGLLLMIISTRPVVYWLDIYSGSRAMARQSDVEGSSIDLFVLGALIIAAVVVLRLRRLNWGVFAASNRSILVMYLFLLASLFWADYPFAVVKRVVKDFSFVLFALMLLTEQDPAYAIRKVFLRCSYIVFTLSVITIKYFPGIGTRVTGAGDNQFIGLTTQKNMLGEVVFTYALILLWDFITLIREEHPSWRDPRVLARALMLYFGIWLLNVSASKTSVLCLIIGVVVYWVTGRLTRRPNLKPKLAGLIVLVLALYGLNSTLHLDELVVHAVGKNMTFTGRTLIWTEVMAQPVDRITGMGFMMFWDSQYGRDTWDEMGTRVSTAHNGYLEMLLDGGIIGVCLLAVMLLARGYVIVNKMAEGDFWGRLGFVYWVLALFQDLSESTFFRFSILWFLLILSMLKLPREALPPRDSLEPDALQPA